MHSSNKSNIDALSETIPQQQYPNICYRVAAAWGHPGHTWRRRVLKTSTQFRLSADAEFASDAESGIRCASDAGGLLTLGRPLTLSRASGAKYCLSLGSHKRVSDAKYNLRLSGH